VHRQPVIFPEKQKTKVVGDAFYNFSRVGRKNSATCIWLNRKAVALLIGIATSIRGLSGVIAAAGFSSAMAGALSRFLR